MKRKRTLVVTFIAMMSLTSTVFASEVQDTQSLLKKSCNIFSQQWVGLKLHYRGGRQEFDRGCNAAINGKDLLPGLWAIRSLVSDGHADFVMPDRNKSLIHPIILNYDPTSKSVIIASVHDVSLEHVVGKRVEFINGKKAVDLLRERATLEPQSVWASSMEVAARTLLFQPDWHPYPNFPYNVTLTLENGNTISTTPVSLDGLWEKDRHILSKNYPSIWGNTINMDTDNCENKDEIAKIISYKGSSWLWWHPTSMKFHGKTVEASLECWSQYIGKVSGVVLDLRDTGGGLLTHMMAVSSMLSPIDHMILQKRISNDSPELEDKEIVAPEGTPQRWSGKTIMITNGLCGSACDILAQNVASAEDVCTYGTPTAGRSNSEEEIKLNDEILLEVPMWEHFDANGVNLEGKPFIPQYMGTGGVHEALDTCVK